MQTLIIVLVLVYILNAISLWRLFTLAGEPAYKAFIPLYNRYTQLEILQRPKWWLVILLIPIVSPIFHFALHADFIRCYGKRKFIDAMLVVLSLGLYVTYVNYDKNTKFIGVEERKETFIASILFAIILATSIHTFIAQPFIIPTGSMESTLKVGDFLIVNKLAYGSRVPMTPVSIPFLQNKIPGTGAQAGNQINSYIDALRLPYWRMPGYEKIKNNSLVVFNYPVDSSHTAIDRKDPYVKRCVGIPGDTLSIVDGNLFINGKREVLPKDAEGQYSYMVTTDGTQLSPKMMEKEIGFVSGMGLIAENEYIVSNGTEQLLSLRNYPYKNKVIIDSVKSYNNGYKLFSKVGPEILNQVKDSIPGLASTNLQLSKQNQVYFFDGLSDKMVSKLKTFSFITGIHKNITPKGIKNVHLYSSGAIDSTNTIFPEDKNWNVDQYGPLYIPKKGDVIKLNKDNITQYYNIVNKYEQSNVQIKDGKIWVDGKVVPTYDYTIQQDYYFMMGDNRHNSLDCRFFGYVPFNHVMGKPTFYWMSLQGQFDNGSYKIRFNRMFRTANNNIPLEDKFNWGWVIIPIIAIFLFWDSRRRKKKKVD